MLSFAATWLIAIVVVVLVFMPAILYSIRRYRRCPSCDVPMAPLSEAPDGPRSYEVLYCAECSNAVTLVHGHRFRHAYCPVCQQRSLETPCIRRDVRDRVEIEVHEKCHICGYGETRIVRGPAAPRPRGIVVPFPTERGERERYSSGEF